MTSTKIMVNQDIVIYALRYALEKSSFAGLAVINSILDNLDYMSDQTIKRVIREVEEAKSIGKDLDKIEWLRFKSKLEKYIEEG